MVESNFSFIASNCEYFVRTVDYERLMGDPGFLFVTPAFCA